MSGEEQYKTDVISIIVPIYNAEEYLERCIESIKKQTYQKWELILVDDGSTDCSLQLCEKIALKDTRIRVIHIENLGVSMARNRGIEEARGEYISFVDADDWVDTKFLEILHGSLQPGDDVIGCQFQICTHYSQFDATQFDEKEWTTVDESWMKEILEGNTRCWSKLYRRQYLAGVRFRQGLSIGEDMLFLLELAHLGGKMHNLDYIGYAYFKNPEGAMNQGISASYMDQISCWKYAYDRVQEDSEIICKMAGREVLVAVIQILDRIAVLSSSQRRFYKKYIEQCRETCKEFQKYTMELNRQHRLKVKIFYRFPSIFWMVDKLYQQKGQR